MNQKDWGDYSWYFFRIHEISNLLQFFVFILLLISNISWRGRLPSYSRRGRVLSWIVSRFTVDCFIWPLNGGNKRQPASATSPLSWKMWCAQRPQKFSRFVVRKVHNSCTVKFFAVLFISSGRSDHDYVGETKLSMNLTKRTRCKCLK